MSFFLTTEYNLDCVIIDPRDISLPKKYSKTLDKMNKQLKVIKDYFDEERFPSTSELVKDCVLIIGMHPDEATVPIVKAALKLNKNFAVVPCCVFPSLFKDRKLKSGQHVVDYSHILQFIYELCKDNNVDVYNHYLKITGRNRVLFTYNNINYSNKNKIILFNDIVHNIKNVNDDCNSSNLSIENTH